ncbi:MAG: hypothetical protein KDK06_06150 [Gammaproteobacteria bacterium]|nr:hypothetical protein [Gammaproteobacteria bacterium]
MGEEIDKTHFAAADFASFAARLRRETDILRGWFADGTLCDGEYRWGFELEAWLLDHGFHPSPVNAEFLATLGDADVVPELSRFNVELNTRPLDFAPHALSQGRAALEALWRRCNACAHGMDTRLVMIGSLPTIRDADLSLANISPLKRYYALNHELLKRNRGRPLDIDIGGREHLATRRADVMLESAATSFQLHFQVPVSLAHLYYNASQVVSAPLVAAAANSPLLFDHLLWEETRIPLFEQSIAGATGAAARRPRVSFGDGFLVDSLMECFDDNLADYPVLLPILFDDDERALRHLRLHNGTLWRWNRPLVGFDGERPHVRIEHRPLPAGPSFVDLFANAAVYLGAVHEWVQAERLPALDAASARANFYAAARDGLDAELVHDGRREAASRWLLETLLPDADAGLARLGLAAAERDRYLGVVAARVASGRTGAAWQRATYLSGGRDGLGLMAAYCAHQASGAPVHEWPLEGVRG